MSGGTQTAEDYYGDLLYDIGAQAQRATDAGAARESLVASLETQYANEAGVSLDEEAVEIMRFQQVYAAATKLMQINNQMMDEMMGLLD